MLRDIWNSFRRLPLWVQVWMVLVLVPVNLYSATFLNSYAGEWIAALAILGMAFNVPIIFRDRGFSKLMSLPHILLWTPLVAFAYWILSSKGGISDSYVLYLRVMIGVNLISLAFDYIDFWKWIKGDRTVA